MSNVFLKNDFNDMFDNITESNVSLPGWVTIIDAANKTNKTINIDKTKYSGKQSGGIYSDTSATNLHNKSGSNYSATSSVNLIGGIFSDTSATNLQNKNASTKKLNNISGGGKAVSSVNSNSVHDVNKLLSMLTSESSTNFNGMSETSTATLENQLRDILKQDGGSGNNSNKTQNGGNYTTINDIKDFFTKNNLGNSPHLINLLNELNNNKTQKGGASDINTTTDIKFNEPEPEQEFNDPEPEPEQMGGGKYKSNKKSNVDVNGGANPGFEAFLKLRKHIAEKLKISNGPGAAKVASKVQNDMKEKMKDADSVTLGAEGIKHFDKNVEHYKQFIPPAKVKSSKK